MKRPRLQAQINVIRNGAVITALVIHYVGESFMWRGVSDGKPFGSGGGLGKCRFEDEGLTWTGAVDGPLLDAFRVAVAL